VLVTRATSGMSPGRQNKRLGFQNVSLTLATVVAGDCGKSGVELLVIELLVLAVTISLAFFRDRVREVELARRGTIKPTNGVCRSGPNDVATAEVMPEGKREDEQEETEQKTHVEEGKGLKNTVASVIDRIRITFHIIVHNNAVYFGPAFYFRIDKGGIGSDCT
jgi:hypothetical protein